MKVRCGLPSAHETLKKNDLFFSCTVAVNRTSFFVIDMERKEIESTQKMRLRPFEFKMLCLLTLKVTSCYNGNSTSLRSLLEFGCSFSSLSAVINACNLS